MTIIEALGYIKDAGSLGVLVLALVGLFRKWWVPYWIYEMCLEENQALRTVLEKNVGNTNTAIELAAKK